MSFWADKINEMRPAQPAQQQQQQAPTSWLQQSRTVSAQPPASPYASQGYQGPSQYAPPEARHLAAEENCPRCGSQEYASVPVDLSFGGRGGMSETGFNMSQPKQCFDCRYPSRDPSGDIVRGKGAVRTGVKAQRRDVVQVGGGEVGSWGGKASWDAAQLIA